METHKTYPENLAMPFGITFNPLPIFWLQQPVATFFWCRCICCLEVFKLEFSCSPVNFRMFPVRSVLLLVINQRRCFKDPFFWLDWDFFYLFLELVWMVCQLDVLCATGAVSLQALVALLSPGVADSQCLVPGAAIASLLAACVHGRYVNLYLLSVVFQIKWQSKKEK